MATGADIVNGALKKLGIKPSDSDISAQEMQDGIETMNDMLIEFEDSGLRLGFSKIENPSDVVRVPRGAVESIKATLAGRLAADYSKQISPALAATIVTANKNMLRIVSRPLRVKFPDTLPTGTGNQCDDVFDDRYFDGAEKENF